MGSLIGALASYLDAKANQGLWLLRMEDLDPPRESAGAAHAILASLKCHGLHWDSDVLWQSQRHADYQQVIDQLLKQHLAFYCQCSRRDLEASNGIHSGICRNQQQVPAQAFAIRLEAGDQPLGFEDAIQGFYSQSLCRQVGDWVLQRKDKYFAYQLAVVVDDAHQGITHIVRGSDLLDSTPRQIFLQQLLGFDTPQYAHIPVITDQQGKKLSKQAHAKALDSDFACQNLLTALDFLQQPLPPQQQATDPESILHWAVSHLQLTNIPATLAATEKT